MTTLGERLNGGDYKGVAAGEIVARTENGFRHLAKIYEKQGSFDPFNDVRLAVCYNFLYQSWQRTGSGGNLEEIKRRVDMNEVSAGRLIYAAWLHTLLTVFRGKLDSGVAQNLVREMKEKGDGVLQYRDGDALSIPQLKREYFAENSPVDADTAIALGTIQMLELLKIEKFFDDQDPRYREMMRGAIPKVG